ncbi:MAG: helix-hairpin-helix domain-containing protein [Bacteroidota bacterium]
MKPFLQSYFEYTRSERAGICVLLSLGILLLIFPTLLSFLFPKEKTDFSTFQKDIIAFEEQQEVSGASTDNQLFAFDPNTVDKSSLIQLGLSEKVADTFIKYRERSGGFKTKEAVGKVYGLKRDLYETWLPYMQIESVKQVKKETSKAKPPIAKVPIRLFLFDPNTATETELKKLGIPKKVISNLLNYRQSNGSFQQKEDLKRLYTLTEKEYNRLADYIVIEQRETTSPPIAANEDLTPKGIPSSYDAVVQSKVIIDINKATAEEWQQLRGIGPAYANRIVKFRTALGGFATVEQVGETYNLPDSTFQSIQLSLRPSPIFKKLKINELDAKALKAHPYVKDWKTANIIINYRKQHGNFSNLEDLRKIKILKEEWLKKMEPYLEF